MRNTGKRECDGFVVIHFCVGCLIITENKRLNCIKITRIVQKINKSSAYIRAFRGHNEDGPDTVVRMLGSDRLGERKTMMREETTIAFMRGSIARLNKKRLIGSIYSDSKGFIKVELIFEPFAVLQIS